MIDICLRTSKSSSMGELIDCIYIAFSYICCMQSIVFMFRFFAYTARFTWFVQDLLQLMFPQALRPHSRLWSIMEYFPSYFGALRMIQSTPQRFRVHPRWGDWHCGHNRNAIFMAAMSVLYTWSISALNHIAGTTAMSEGWPQCGFPYVKTESKPQHVDPRSQSWCPSRNEVEDQEGGHCGVDRNVQVLTAIPF